MSSVPPPAPAENLPPAEKVKQFPTAPGVYLMKDAQGRVIYVGKAKNLRNRAGHYFTKAAAEDHRTADLVKLIADIDFLPADSEVDALLLEARLVKDIQPRFNVELKDDKIVSLSANPHARGFPARRVHAHAAAARRQALRPVHQRQEPARTPSRCCSASSSSAPARWTSTRTTTRWRWFRPCLLHSIRQCTAPCNFRVTKEEYRKQIRALAPGAGRQEGPAARARWSARCRRPARRCSSRRRPGCATTSPPCKKLGLRGDVDKDVQPEVFPIEPKKGLRRPAQGAGPGEDAAHHRGRGHRPPRRRGHGGVAGVVHRRLAVQAGLSPLQHQVGARASTISPRSARW